MALPTPTSAAATVDYIPANVRRFQFVTTIAAQATPTSAELSIANSDYTKAMVTLAGFNQSAADVDNSTYGSDFQTNIAGMRSATGSSWTLKASSTGTDSRAILSLGTNGYVVIYEEGINSTGKMDVWPVRIKSSNVDQVAKDSLSTITVEFTITGSPSLNLAIPTV